MAIEERLLGVWKNEVIPGPPEPARNLRGKQRILNFIMLFEAIDSSSANYNWTPLATLGLVDPLSDTVKRPNGTERGVDE